MLIETERTGLHPAHGGPPERRIRIATAARTLEVCLRRLETIAEYRECELLQARIWGPEDVGSVSSLVMMTAQENGGMAIGAFVGERLAGFVCSFPGYAENGTPKQCSVLMAVEPELRNGGVGYHLKRMQREATLAQGLDLITWTFDPLVSVNANLNVNKLGCVAARYVPDCYGTFAGGLNAGMATDRLLVEWWIREPRVEECLSGVPPALPAGAEPVNEVAAHPATGLAVPRRADLGRGGPALLVEAPADIQAIKRSDMGLARAWAEHYREVFPHYFARRYRVCGFVPVPAAGELRRAYLLRRAGSPEGGRA